MEADSELYLRNQSFRVPVPGLVTGETARPCRSMGHAGAIIGGAEEAASNKKRIVRKCGIHAVDSPAGIGAPVIAHY